MTPATAAIERPPQPATLAAPATPAAGARTETSCGRRGPRTPSLSAMRRVVITLAALAAFVVAVLLPALTSDSSASSSPETTTITRYLADFTVTANGDLEARETLTVHFPDPGSHGIYRFFDQHDASAARTLRIPHDITVTRDGHPEQVDLSTRSHGRFLVARIGRPDVTIGLADHTYVIRYRIDGVLEPGTDGATSQFYWNVIPGGWQQGIERARIAVHLPAAPAPVQCVVGTGAGSSGCPHVVGEGAGSLFISTGALPPRTPVTLKAGLDIPTPPAGDPLPWSASLVPILGDSVAVLVVVLILGAAGLVVGLLLARGSRERPPAFPLQYAPPDGVGPAGAAYVVNERVDEQAFVASLLWAAEKGAVDLRREADGWTIADKSGAAGWAAIDPVTAEVAPLVGGPGGTFTAGKRDVSAGQELQSRIKDFESSTRAWGLSNGFLVRAGLGSAGGLLVVVAVFLAFFAALATWFGMSISGLVFAGFALGASPLLRRGAATRRTPKGRDLWSRVGGFERMLSTPSSKQRFDFSGRQDLYTAYIPWAVAFGCAEAWAKKYRTEVGTEPPVPSYFAGYYAGAHTGDYVSQMVGDFTATVNSSIAAYAATQTSSSGGGGGFSGGGGGGGGGGGSW